MVTFISYFRQSYSSNFVSQPKGLIIQQPYKKRTKRILQPRPRYPSLRKEIPALSPSSRKMSRNRKEANVTRRKGEETKKKKNASKRGKAREIQGIIERWVVHQGENGNHGRSLARRKCRRGSGEINRLAGGREKWKGMTFEWKKGAECRINGMKYLFETEKWINSGSWRIPVWNESSIAFLLRAAEEDEAPEAYRAWWWGRCCMKGSHVSRVVAFGGRKGVILARKSSL